MSNDAVELLCRDALRSGINDWVGLWELVVEGRVDLGIRDDEVLRGTVLKAIELLLTRGYAELGDVGSDGFRPWAGNHPDAVRRVEQEWIKLGRDPDPGDIVWLRNTKAGNELAASLLGKQ